MIDPHFFTGFTIGAAATFFISTIWFAAKYQALWDLKESLRHHPTADTGQTDIRKLGDWGSALEGWVDDE